MRWWGGLVGAFFAFACQQGASPVSGDPDSGTVYGPPDDGGSPDGGSPDGGPDGGSPFTHPGWPPPRPGYLNPIPAENQRSGDPSWNRGFSRPWAAQVEAYADRVSASAGETVRLMVRTDQPGSGAAWTLYRIGWYGGAGARRLASGTAQLGSQPACPKDPASAMIRCSWSPTFSLRIPQDAVSGLFLVRIVADDGFGVLIPVVVKDDRPADLLMESAVLTAQAYNHWGGTGLYDPPGAFAVQVSFDRPYDSDSGSGQVLRYEALMARFLERYGYDVTYTTNLDVAREGKGTLLRRGAFLSVGHDEYWPGEQRDAVEAARDEGLPIYFFGANAAYWKVRLSNPGIDGNARVVTCYKRHPESDPLAGTPQQTGRFRDDPINRSEEELVGTMYESWMLFGMSWTAQNVSHAMYEGTGLQAGDTIPQLVGYEYDRTFELDTPNPVDVLARSPVVDAEGKPGLSEATLYTAPSGALVFGAGSIYWPFGVDGPMRDPRVERMTANLLQIGLQLPVPSALRSVSAPPQPTVDARWATSVRTLASGMPGPAGVAQLADGTFLVADPRAHRIWQADGTGKWWAFAGDGNPTGNPRYDNVPALSARFFGPTAVLPDAAGNVYVADTHNCVIRKIANDANRTVSLVAGAFLNEGYADGAGGAARLSYPMGMAWLDATHIVFADSGNQAIRVLDVTTRAVSTLAATHWGDDADGPASSASFYYPTAVAVAPDGRVFFLASSTGKVKVIGTDAARTVTTLVGGGLGFSDGPGTAARMQPQMGLLWLNGSLIVSDSANQRLRWVSPGASAGSTTVKTWAGSGLMGSDDGLASAASFQVPLGLWAGKDGSIYLIDGGAGALRAVRP
jgi:hypothetical protein